jgi:two-component system, chemotaxis family, protein-glutamate methylesterase/glutaminase
MGIVTSGFDERLHVAAVGASAGGVEALMALAASMPPDLPCAVLVVLHMPSGSQSLLARILDRSGPLTAVAASDGAQLRAARMYVAEADEHLLVRDGQVVLSDGPTENGHRPAIDALFRSVARSHGPRATGVLLSGVLDDGVLGCAAIRSRGGTTIAQRPTDAVFPDMPRNAIEAGVIDEEATAAEIGGLLAALAKREFEEPAMECDAKLELENRIAMGRRFSTRFDTEVLGAPPRYVCPDCHGSLQEVSDGNYRCQVGHGWTADALLQARDDEAEGALWVALRSLQEKCKMARKLAANIGPGRLYEKYTAIADEADHAVSVLGARLAGAYGDEGELGAG